MVNGMSPSCDAIIRRVPARSAQNSRAKWTKTIFLIARPRSLEKSASGATCDNSQTSRSSGFVSSGSRSSTSPMSAEWAIGSRTALQPEFKRFQLAAQVVATHQRIEMCMCFVAGLLEAAQLHDSVSRFPMRAMPSNR